MLQLLHCVCIYSVLSDNYYDCILHLAATRQPAASHALDVIMLVGTFVA